MQKLALTFFLASILAVIGFASFGTMFGANQAQGFFVEPTAPPQQETINVCFGPYQLYEDDSFDYYDAPDNNLVIGRLKLTGLSDSRYGVFSYTGTPRSGTLLACKPSIDTPLTRNESQLIQAITGHSNAAQTYRQLIINSYTVDADITAETSNAPLISREQKITFKPFGVIYSRELTKDSIGFRKWIAPSLKAQLAVAYNRDGFTQASRELGFMAQQWGLTDREAIDYLKPDSAPIGILAPHTIQDDDFDRANQTGLGTGSCGTWTQGGSVTGFDIVSNQASYQSTTGDDWAYCSGTVSSDDHTVSVEVHDMNRGSGSSGVGGIYCRMNGTNETGILLDIQDTTGTDLLRLFEVDNSSFTAMDSSSVTRSFPNTLVLECDDTSKDGSFNGASVSGNDNNITGGVRGGIRGAAIAVDMTYTVDDFLVDDGLSGIQVQSVSDSGPMGLYHTVSFALDWAQATTTRALICKTDSVTASTTTPTCDGGTWADNGEFTSTDPITNLKYTTRRDDEGTNAYYAFACEGDTPQCSPSSSGTFRIGDNPYPQSYVLHGLDWDFDNEIIGQGNGYADGSDLFPVTWLDDAIYWTWGDGGGFSGENNNGRVGLGLGFTTYTTPQSFGPNDGTDVNGGLNPISGNTDFPNDNDGKSSGILALENTDLYFWKLNQDGTHTYDLYFSDDMASTTSIVPTTTFDADDLAFQTFVQYGQNYDGPHGGYVYQVGGVWGASGVATRDIFMARVASSTIETVSTYEYFSGFNGQSATWATSTDSATPIFSDYTSSEQNMGLKAQISYNAPLERYILTMSKDGPGGLGVFESANPWGPWYTVDYYANSNWGGRGDASSDGEGLLWAIPNMWLSDDGLTWWVIWSGTRPAGYDAFNLIEVRALKAQRLIITFWWW